MSVCILYRILYSPTGDFKRLIPGPIAREGKCGKIFVGVGVAMYWGWVGGGGGVVDRQLTADITWFTLSVLFSLSERTHLFNWWGCSAVPSTVKFKSQNLLEITGSCNIHKGTLRYINII
jgi:hypothetical protein